MKRIYVEEILKNFEPCQKVDNLIKQLESYKSKYVDYIKLHIVFSISEYSETGYKLKGERLETDKEFEVRKKAALERKLSKDKEEKEHKVYILEEAKKLKLI